MKKKEVTSPLHAKHKGKVHTPGNNYDVEFPLWCFNNVDNAGTFRFSKETVDSSLLIDKLLSLSKLSWAEIKMATHDKGKSKHHELDCRGISESGKSRIKAKNLSEEDVDSIFSFALTNKVRVIGLKKGRTFHVIWYDKLHDFYPSSR